MKEVHLPITQTIRIPLKPDPSKIIDHGNGSFSLPLGEVSSSDYSPLVEIARKNGGNVLYATTSIEHQLENILMQYFMGPFTKHEEKRLLFEREILQSTALGYKSKKDLVSTIVRHENLLDSKKQNLLQQKLKQIMDWRNAFAHGKLIYDTAQGCHVNYYSGSAKTLQLTDDYWGEVEKCFQECIDLLKVVESELYQKHKSMRSAPRG